MTRAARCCLRLGAAALALSALLVLAGVALLRASLPAIDGEQAVTGLSGPVVVTRDALGVPTVRGRTRLDVARATGFLHAQDRFFQMDLLRRVAAGRLSELFGAAALDADRGLRLHGLAQVATRAAAGMDRMHAALLDAYVDGVNAGLSALAVRPPEYLLLRQTPQRWTRADTLLAILAMHLRLSDADAQMDERRGRLLDCVPAPVADFLSSDDPAFAATLDGAPLTRAPLPAADVYDLRTLGALDFDAGRSFADTLAADPNLPAGASNAWAAAGSRTDDGRALVANDMHLGLAVPNTWYRMRLVVDGPRDTLDVSGVTLPGGPAVVAGSNGRVAWGFTNSYGDWSDRITLRIDPDDPSRYRTASGTETLAYREERIEVHGGDPVAVRIPVSVFGPVTTDWRGRPVAIRWLGHDPGALNLDIVDLERAASLDDALAIAPRLGIPPQNLVAGDAAGRVGWTVAGRIPARRGGYEPRLPRDSTTPDAGWDGWLPAARYPRIVDPADGLVWTANAQVVGGAALDLIGDSGYWHGARARQIRDRLRALPRADEAAMLALQLDDRALLHRRWHALLGERLERGRASTHPGAGELREVLAGWNGRASADSAAFRLVWSFRMRVRDVVFAAVTAPCRALDAGYRYRGFRQSEGVLWRLLTERPAHLLHPGHADWDALLDAVAIETADHVATLGGPAAEQTWGEANPAHLRHPFSRAFPALAPLLDIGPDPSGGASDVPKVMSFGNAASERFAVRPGREADGILQMPGGQSGHLLSPFYRAGHEDWLHGRRSAFLPGPPAHRLTLTPATGR